MDEMRRKDRQLTKEEAMNILLAGEYGVLSTIGEDGYPYAVPVNYVVENETVYIHGTCETGKKMSNIQHSPKVCFTVVGKTEVLSAKFGTKYESAIVYGTAAISEEPQLALEKFIDKYSSEYRESGMKYIRNSIDKITIYEIRINEITGKARR